MFSWKPVQLVKNQYRNAHFQAHMRKSQEDYYLLFNNNNNNTTLSQTQ